MSKKLPPQGNSLDRQKWLETATAQLRKLVGRHEPVPAAVRVTVGWPKGSRGGHAIGQCWGPQTSADGHAEVFISPELGQRSEAEAARNEVTTEVLGVLAHELVHAAVGVEAGHKAPFKRVATAIGLTGKMTATVPGPEFVEWAATFIGKHGHFPHAKLTKSAKLTQPTRLLKVMCPDCGYVARITQKWLDEAGAPICPVDAREFICE